jgi:hypothetical protein
VAESRRHAELEKQMQLTHGSETEGSETEGGAEVQSTGDKSLDDERARIEAQKKARRKAAKR